MLSMSLKEPKGDRKPVVHWLYVGRHRGGNTTPTSLLPEHKSRWVSYTWVNTVLPNATLVHCVFERREMQQRPDNSPSAEGPNDPRLLHRYCRRV